MVASHLIPARRAWLLTAALLGAIACEDVTHENIEKWRSTVKGPGKLAAALNSSEHDPELRAHAAQVLISMDEFPKVGSALEAMPDPQRHAVTAQLVPRLWKDARIAREMDQPTGLQRAAKDALFEIRSMADDATREAIDKHLLDWLTGGYYEGRAAAGRVSGKTIVGTIGEKAGPRLLAAARKIIASPPDEKGRRVRVGDRLLRGLAFSSDPEAVAFVLELVGDDRRDPTLPQRAMAALHEAFAEPVGVEPADPKALVPHRETLIGISRDEGQSGRIINEALDLIAVMGLPHCLEPFVEMVSYPHAQRSFRWIGTQKGLRCGGADAIIPLAEAFPVTGAYQRGILERYFWKDALELEARGKVAERARTLLQSESWVARVTGIELLGALEREGQAAEDAKKIRRLADDDTVLRGWWGKQEDVPRSERKRDPTLGQIAVNVANSLHQVEKGGDSQ